MPLNILHHKSWNVYNKSNIEKVRRDEALARKKEEEKEMRMREADGKRRLKILRERSGFRESEVIEDRIEHLNGNSLDNDRAHNQSTKDSDVHLLKNERKRKKNDNIAMLDKELKRRREPSQNKHINFWEDFESGKVHTDYSNPEYEKEKADADKKWNDIITMQLSNSSKEMSPWYSHLSLQSSAQRKKDQQSIERDMRIQNSIKDFNDPLTAMQSYLKQKKKIKDLDLNKKACNPLDEYNHSRKTSYEEYTRSSTSDKAHKDINKDKALEGTRLSREFEEKRKLQSMSDFSNQYITEYKIVGKYSSQYNPEYVNKYE
ncbi:hypothetical protein T552_02906 [Pneumocystis carinii B80]|uniref:CBF1-interacting co-repressor CIR N-terminal domain-containing protein n=1 Tax=Pneumocystis carinii (strain B80) TaxID=1408658 RepID=A0A0W4ZDF7_PNEC8|nr:hypothetical protein T552_02906 [Pneumocystis carinii B80]KTW26425.1 hypothetical protein T552_02906 [Pneumocystis carinii B80]